MNRRSLPAFLFGAAVVALGLPGGPPASAGAASEPAVLDRVASPEAEPVEVAGFDLPESVLADPLTDTYLVSNIAGRLPAAATAHDGNGFISRLGPAGEVRDLHWIGAGGSNDVKLDAPKGLALSGRFLYVADISRVLRFDRFSGRLLGVVEIPESTFLNDVTTRRGGGVYVSDSGVRFAADGSTVPTETDAIYAVGPQGDVTTIAAGPGLGSPNGLAVDGCGRLRVAPLDLSRQVFTPLPDGSRTSVINLPAGGLDGLVLFRDGSLLVSSFETGAVYQRLADGTTTVVYDASQAADIGIDRRRGALLLPLINDGVVRIQPLRAGPA